MRFYLFIFIFLSFLSCVVPGDKVLDNKTPSQQTDDNTTSNLTDYNNLFNHSNIHEIEIQITQSEWDGLISDMRVNMRTGNYRKATFVYHGINGDKKVEEIGFRTRGNTTRVIPEEPKGSFRVAHFMIKFNETFSLTKGTTEYQTRSDRRFCNLRSLNMKWARDDYSLVRELYAYDLLNRAGVYAPKSGLGVLTINIAGVKKYYGVYTLIEPVNKSFLTRRYTKDNNDGNLYKCLWQDAGPATLEKGTINDWSVGIEDWKANYHPSYDLTTNDDTPNFNDLKDFVNNINDKTGTDFKTYIETNFEVDRFLRWIAVNQLVGMPDDYWAMGNNYYIYFNKQKTEFIPYDYDHGLGGGWLPFDTANANIFSWRNLKKEYGLPNNGQPLIDKILAITEYKEKYKNYLKDFITIQNKLFVYSDYEKRFNDIKTLLTPYLKNPNGVSGVATSMTNGQKSYFLNRTKSVATQLGLNTADYETK
ncbi:MAG: hypothetical protein A2086_15550 [Spirochaetes bacterium GWD1_27_9]|nr:MAG: hypothetical protein A2Z98_14995 [Spirochaetes bacterium GWB1_27_13]OHD27672.1 MAG: hypothetical protein A2Y34_07305 [Spirochaetes bacterium GWC1_27_15]OHD42797.1 MAG: hypothetical protein A2086_15550 [Spirochaetes bacterium GWD1_27_9]